MDTPVRSTTALDDRRAATLLATTQRALWPLVKLLVHRGIAYPTLTEALKSAFIRVALQEFPLQGKRDTDSRISLLTGIHRRDVKRLRDAMRTPPALDGGRDAGSAVGRSAAAAPTQTEISLAARVVAIWTGSPDYLDVDGEPKPLPRLARQGGDRSFESLVRAVSKDIRPRALLDEWLRRDAVALDDEDRVCLNLDAFMAHKDLDQKAFYFGQNIHDHLAAIAHNLTDTEHPFPEQCVFHTGLSTESIAELSQLARGEAARALQLVERRALELKARDAGNLEARGRVNFGMYFYSATGRPAAPAEASASPSDDEPEN
jgi:hypothetical protein